MLTTPALIERKFKDQLCPEDLRELKRYAAFRLRRGARKGVFVSSAPSLSSFESLVSFSQEVHHDP